MGDGYYPKYYQKKKKRDQIYFNVWRVIGGLGLGVVLGAIAFTVFPLERRANGATDLAKERAALESKLDNQALLDSQQASSNRNAKPSPPIQASLDQIGYAAAQPAVHIEVEGVSSASTDDPHTIQNEPVTGGEVDTGDIAGENSEGESHQTPGEGDRLSRGQPTTGGNDQQTDSEAEASSTTEQPKPKPAEVDQDKEPKADPPPKVDDSPKPGTKPKGTITYRVFAGYFTSREEAVSRKKDLSTLGFSGTVREDAGSFSIYVSEFADSDSATAFRDKLISNGFQTAFAVVWQN